MKNFKTKVISFFIFAFLLIPTLVSADPGDPNCNPDEPCPIDDNIIYLAVTVVILAAYKYFVSHSKKITL